MVHVTVLDYISSLNRILEGFDPGKRFVDLFLTWNLIVILSQNHW